MSEKKRNSNAGKHRARRRLMLLCLFPVLVVMFIMSAYAINKLYVTEIVVVGESRYTDEEVIAAAGIAKGDKLLLQSKDSAREAVLAELPYLEAVEINLIPPGTVRIELTPAVPFCVALLPEGSYVIGESMRILGPADTGCAGLSAISSDFPQGQQEGAVLEFISEIEGRLCVDILELLKDNNILKDISLIDISNTAELSLVYLDRFTVKLGDKQSLPAKLELVMASAQSLGEEARGVLDATLSGRVSFRPERKGKQIDG